MIVALKNPCRAWQIAITTGMHFEGKLNAWKYNFHLKNLNESSFARRNDKYFYEKFIRSYTTEDEFLKFLVANILAGSKWIGAMNRDNYLNLQKKIDACLYLFKAELKTVAPTVIDFDHALLINSDVEPPPLLRLYREEKCSLEFITLIEALTSFLSKVGDIQDPIGLWSAARDEVKRYQPFLLQFLGHDTSQFKDAILAYYDLSTCLKPDRI